MGKALRLKHNAVVSEKPLKAKKLNSPFVGWNKAPQLRTFNLRHFTEDLIERMSATQPDLSYTNIVHPSVPTLLEGDPRKLQLLFTTLLAQSSVVDPQKAFSLEVYSIDENSNHIQFRFRDFAKNSQDSDVMERLRQDFCNEAVASLGGSIERSAGSEGSRSILVTLPLNAASKSVKFADRPKLDKKRVLVSSGSAERIREISKQLKLRGLQPSPLPFDSLAKEEQGFQSLDCILIDSLALDVEKAKGLRKILKVATQEKLPLAFLHPRPDAEVKKYLSELTKEHLNGAIKQSELYALMATLLYGDNDESVGLKKSQKLVESTASKSTSDAVLLDESKEEEDSPSGLFARMGRFFSQ